MNASTGYESPGIAGSGAIATGLAAVSTTTGDTILLARSEASAWRAEEKVVAACAKIDGAEPSRLRVTTDPDRPRRVRRHRRGDRRGGRRPRASCSRRSARPAPTPTSRPPPPRSASPRSPRPPARDKLFGLHVFNPVPRMKLVEVCFPDGADRRPREGPGLVRGARQDRGRGPRPGRLRRQPAALPLPLRRRAADRADRHGGRRGRHLHEARRRPPDGPAGAARLRRPRRLRGDRRRALRRERRGRQQAAGADGRDGRRGQAGPQVRRRLLQYD